MTKTTYPKERGGVITAMKKLFYDWLSIRPSNYPPNYFPGKTKGLLALSSNQKRRL
jgi:hypothetical protein